ncbi:MAG: DNA cytosine methyltransferase, partial [Bacteroidota bacterium]
LGYGISYTILNSANYGVAQKRLRFFLIGIKNIENPAFPLPTHYSSEKDWLNFVSELDKTPDYIPKPYIKLKEVFEQIPNDIQNRSDYAVMNISDFVVERMKLIKQGENFKVLPMKMRPNCWKNGKHQGQDTFGRLRMDEPSVTIRTAAYNPAKGKYIHPIENRGLNTIEMATIQSFPLDWVIKCNNKDNVTLVSAGRQIGNAVPPLLAKALGEAIKLQLLM